MKLATFDIFDTTLLRLCGAPENVFFLVSQRLFPSNEDKRNIFLLWRLSAEMEATRINGSATTIEDIYKVPGLEGLTDKSISELVETEFSVEKEMLKPYTKVAELIRKYKNDGYKIAFVSDMYLPSSFLESILRDFNLLSTDDDLFVSNEYNARKSDGSLFRIVKETIKPTNWFHYGDNEHSDIRMAKKYGAKACKVDTSLSVTENNLITVTKHLVSHYESSLLAGAMRYSRLTSRDAMEVFASLFVSPIYIPYVYYVKDKVTELQSDRVYFLSRDAYILMKAYEKIKDKDTESKYFFASRKSLILPFYYVSDQESFLGAFSGHTLIEKEISGICKALKITSKDLFSAIGKKEFEKVESKEQERMVMTALFDSMLAQKIRIEAKTEYGLFVNYLEQEGLLEPGNHIMVDVGWIGTTRLMMNKILNSVNAKPVHFIYYSTNKGVYPYKYGSYSSFIPYDGSVVPYLEQYFSECPYPSTMGYSRVNGRVSPVFAPHTKYEESDVLNANLVVMSRIMDILSIFNLTNKDALKCWAYTARNSLVDCKENIDYGVLSRIKKDKHEFVMSRKFTKVESLKFLIGVNTRLYYEIPSAIQTFGFNFAHFYLPINKLLNRIRKKLERKIKQL